MLIAVNWNKNIILRISSTDKICATLELRNFLNAEVDLHCFFPLLFIYLKYFLLTGSEIKFCEVHNSAKQFLCTV